MSTPVEEARDRLRAANAAFELTRYLTQDEDVNLDAELDFHGTLRGFLTSLKTEIDKALRPDKSTSASDR